MLSSLLNCITEYNIDSNKAVELIQKANSQFDELNKDYRKTNIRTKKRYSKL